ncbi:MAG: TylF/MycF/NovP-related O-methyltransferase [Spirochaetia bacterium]
MNMKEVKEAIALLRGQGYGIIPPDQYCVDMPYNFLSIWERISDYTMTSIERGFALYNACIYLAKNEIPGDIVECGVWKGGSSMLAALSLMEAKETTRDLWMYDTFTGMTEPSEHDKIASTGQSVYTRWQKTENWWAAGLESVKSNLKSTGYPTEKQHLIQGDVTETLKTTKPTTIGLLRLDTDWYESTKTELEILYPKLAIGGVLVIDDYGHFTGARKAVDDYFHKIGLSPYLHRADYTGRIMIKRK